MTLTEVFSDIASAINNKGVSGSMKPTEMADKIAEISSGGSADIVGCEIRMTNLMPTITAEYNGGSI